MSLLFAKDLGQMSDVELLTAIIDSSAALVAAKKEELLKLEQQSKFGPEHAAAKNLIDTLQANVKPLKLFRSALTA